MFCKQCGSQLDASVKFCDKCGTAVEGSNEAVSVTSGTQSAVTPTATAPTGTTAAATVAKLPGFASIFKMAWKNFVSKFWRLIGMQILMILPFIVLVLIGIGIATALGENFNNIIIIITLFAAVFVAGIAAIYWAIWMQAAIIQTLLDEAMQPIKQTLTTVRPKLLNFFVAGLLSGGIIILGMLALVIPGLILGVIFVFSTYIAIAENKSGVESFKQSRQYVKGRFWAVAGRFILFGLIYFGFFWIIAIIDLTISSMLDLGDVQILSNLVSFFVSALTSAFVAAMYVHLRQLSGSDAKVAQPGLNVMPAGVVAPASAVAPVESKGHRWYIVLAVIGGLMIPLMLLASVVLLALNSARVKSRDAKRVADVRQIAVALDLYYNENRSFPVNLSALASGNDRVFDQVPVAPEPADGDCTPESNKYMYSYVSTQEFALTFCLGQETQGFKAGKNVLTQQGMNPSANSPSIR